MFKRSETRQVKVGNLIIGGENRVIIQSMTKSRTKDVLATVQEILELESIGVELVRCAVLDERDANAISEIVKFIHIPLVADIHFDYKLAIKSLENGASKIRINPGNISKREDIIKLVEEAQKKRVPIRIGINSGSLPEVNDTNLNKYVLAAKLHIDILESLNFRDIIVSLKASNIEETIEANIEFAKLYDYPLHLGLTEAGDLLSGTVKSTIGLSKLLELGLGNTIRVSLSSTSLNEVKVTKQILKSHNLLDNYVELISCPTCGRCEYNTFLIINEISDYIHHLKKNLKVAIMGCVVNGIGEGKNADIGIAFGKDSGLLFIKGEVIKKIDVRDAINILKEEINKF
ncbi:MAG: flavodoxin-dependent (E)-4-hydroxy-3-methylbut-2-enyl-diphosphate synthase [Acholeplasmatales bacterium]|jgi:(E)-4-hydroxy-3-methylbut-2-enyl-diphosphate synthase|nr:flavodoxin-dependent (E)-4-hydroxy-3-methylbut-2-enyl-diphosphate synthase [Acholeplasmatales bacterium]